MHPSTSTASFICKSCIFRDCRHVADPSACHVNAQAPQLPTKARKKALFFVKASKIALDKSDLSDLVRTCDGSSPTSLDVLT